MVTVNCKRQTILASLIAGAVVVAAFFYFALVSRVSAALAPGVTQDQIDAALEDLSEAYGQPVSDHDQAEEICDKEQFFTVCAEIGQKHSLFSKEDLPQVQTLLEEIKGTVAQELQSCQSIECLMGVADKLAASIGSRHPKLASDLDLTSKIIKEKQEVVTASKEAGVDFKTCEDMDPETASVDVLRKCAKLARDSRIRKYAPVAIRDQIDKVGDFVDGTADLQEALAVGRYQCGDNTTEGCGNFCLNPSPEARAQGVIPPVCLQIAKDIFGEDGVGQLKSVYQQVGQVQDFYNKKALNVTFITLDGKTLTKLEDIGRYMEEQGRSGNVEAVSKGMDFMIAKGFATPTDKEFAVKMISRFKEKGQVVDFDACGKDFRACEDFIPEDYRDDFGAMNEVFTIMAKEIGFNPDLCERGGSDPSIGLKCLEGAKRALPQLETLVAKNPQVKFIIEEIRGHISRGDDSAKRANEFRGGEFSGPGGCKSERECSAYCSTPSNGPECISFGAKHEISGFRGEEAVERFQEFQYNIRGPSAHPSFPPPGEFRGQGPFPGFQPPGFGYPPPPGQFPGFHPDSGPAGPSPECFAAIQSGDFVRAKEVCSNFAPPPPGPAPICPATPYVECPAGQYRESFRNNDGCWVDGPCISVPTYSPGPYPTGPYPTGPYPTYSPGATPQCSDGQDNDNDGKVDFPADSSCYGPDDWDEYYPKPGDTPSCPAGQWWDYAYNKCTSAPACGAGYYWDESAKTCKPSSQSNCSPSLINLLGSGCHFMYTSSSGKAVYCDGPMTKSAGEGDATASSGCSGGGYSPGPTVSPGGTAQCSDGQDNDGDGLVDYPSDSGCYSSTDNDETPGTTSSGTCPGGSHIMYVNNAGGYCMSDSDSSKCGPLNSTSASGFGSCSSYQSTASSTPVPSCPTGQWWDPAINVCKTATPYDTTSPTATSCPSGQWWDYATNSCKTSTGTYSPYPSPTGGTGCPTGSHSMGGYCMSDSDASKCGPSGSTSTSSFGSCSSYQSTVTYSPYPSSAGSYTPYPSPGTCPAGQYWYWPSTGPGYCQSTTATYTPYPVTSYTPYPTTVYTPYPTTEYTPYPTTVYTPYPTTEYTPYPTTAYTPYPTTEYVPPPTSSTPPTSLDIHKHYVAMARTGQALAVNIMSCADSGGKWNAGSLTCRNGGGLIELFASIWKALFGGWR